MPMTPEELDRLIQQPEGPNLEFKAARSQFHSDTLYEYCVAFANEQGGRLVLGVSDKQPRRVVGTKAYPNPSQTESKIFSRLGFRVKVDAVSHPMGRVVIFTIPSRPVGAPVEFQGRYLMRAGSSLVPMSSDHLRGIFNETMPNWLEECSLTNLTSRSISDLLDIQGYIRLRNPKLSETPAEAIDHLLMDGIIVEDGNGYSIPRLSALVLAKDLGNFPELKHKTPRVAIYDGTGKSRIRITRDFNMGYGVGFESMVEFIMSQLPQNEVIESALRAEVKLVPEIVIREFLANALIHQDFSLSGRPVRVEVYGNRVEISNLGSPIVPLDRFIDEDKSRNEGLAHLMRRLRICEQQGSGIDRAIETIEIYQLPAPQFREGHHSTSVIIYGLKEFEEMNHKDRIRACYQHCALKCVMGEPMNNQSLRERFGLQESGATKVSQVIAATIEERLIKLDPRAGTSRKYARYLPSWALI